MTIKKPLYNNNGSIKESSVSDALIIGTTKSAYDIAVEKGFVGTEKEWLNSLIGRPGPNGEKVINLWG